MMDVRLFKPDNELVAGVWLLIAVAAIALFLFVRHRHMVQLRQQLYGPVEVAIAAQHGLASALNIDTAEFPSVGAVTFVDLALHYSLADPAIWEHMSHSAARHSRCDDPAGVLARDTSTAR